HSRRIMTIKKNGNTIDKNDFSVAIDATTDYGNPAGSALGKGESTGSQSAIFLMRRLLQINFTPQAGHSISTPVNVRFYWDDGSIALNEKQKALDNLNTLIAAQGLTVGSGPTFQWFKGGGQDIAAILSGLTPGGIPPTTGSQVWSDAADGTHTYGTDGTIPYVEFNNVTSFSTFGGAWFVNQVDGSALPVNFLSFDAAKTTGGVSLTWSVAQQQNCKGYHVCRSKDGVTWTRIAFVAAQSPAMTNTYAFTDATPADGDNYYRIEEEDLDARLTYSIVRKVNFGSRHFTATVYPVPAHNMVWMNIEASQYEKAMVKIVDMQGKVLRIQMVSLQAGFNKVGSEIGDLAAGIYFLEITGTSGKWTGKIIKE
ncbi:MAG TPA: T9SS type A sorting domain-containing protein, partial [Puia sp.]